MLSMSKKCGFFVVLILVASLLCAMIVGCDRQDPSNTTDPSQGSEHAKPTPPGNTEGVVISPTDDEENPGSIEIVLPNEDDGEEGDTSAGGNGNSGNQQNSDPSQPTQPSQGAEDPSQPTQPSQGNDDPTQPTQGNDGADDGGDNSTDSEYEDPDLVIDFDDLYPENNG